MQKHNFNAGPSILPREVIEKTAQAILDYNGSGLSLMEISHRAKDFQPVVDEARALFKELLQIPDGYSWYPTTSWSTRPLTSILALGRKKPSRKPKVSARWSR